MTKKRLFVDMDGTLARFHDQVNYLERMFEKDFFRTLEPFENMVSGLQLLIKHNPDIEVYVISAKVESDPNYCEEEKNQWLDIYLPQIDEDHRIFTEMGRSKADYIPGGLTKDDFLLDDYNRGLNLFLYGGGSVIKCHNNINQRGLGLYGGSAGHMWMGRMVHTSDKPELIAAEISKHMGLEHDLKQVLSAYPDISFLDARGQDMEYPSDFKKHIKQLLDTRFLAVDTSFDTPVFHGFSDPLNAVRFLSGNPDFQEYLLTASDGKKITATAQELRAVCFNLYQNPDFKGYLHADRTQLADDVLSARTAAEKPIIGQITYLGTDGKPGYSQLFFTHEDMRKEVLHCENYGIPIKEEQFIQPKHKPFYELNDLREMTDRLYYGEGIPRDEAYYASKTLLIPYAKRSDAQMQDLVAFWHTYKIPDDLQRFLRLTDAEMQDFVTPGKHKITGLPLDAMIKNADQKAGNQEIGQTISNPERI